MTVTSPMLESATVGGTSVRNIRRLQLLATCLALLAIGETIGIGTAVRERAGPP